MAYETWRKVKINQFRDYLIDVSASLDNGGYSTRYGVIWGREDGNNLHYFVLYEEQKCASIGYFYEGKRNVIADKKPVKNILTINNFKIYKNGNFVNYILNDDLIIKSNEISFYGGTIGFSISDVGTALYNKIIIMN